MMNQPITIYGDGKQVRDILHVNDLARAYEAAIERQDDVNGHAFNVGGGPNNTMSLLELTHHLEVALRRPLTLTFSSARPGDQKIYVSDIGKAVQRLGWSPDISPSSGVGELIEWISVNRVELHSVLKSKLAAKH